MLKYLITVVTALLAILAVFKDHFFPKGVPSEYVALYVTLIIMLSGYQVIQIYNESKKEQYFEYSGTIKGSTIEYPALKIGSAIFRPSDNFTGPLFNIDGDPIRVWLEDGVLQLHTIIRDRKGNIAAVWLGNEFKINPNSIFDYNYDDRALEVLDEYGDVILQVQMENDGVLFAGKFYRKDGWRLGIGYNFIELQPPDKELELKFEPIFKYLGKDNLGIRK